MEAVAYPGFSRVGLGDQSPSVGSGAPSQPLAQFCYLKANVEVSEALQVLNLNVQCVLSPTISDHIVYTESLTIIIISTSIYIFIALLCLLHHIVTLSLLAHIFSLTRFTSSLLARA